MTAPAKRVGYIGVGLMGLPMVKRLVSRHYRVTVYDVVPRQVEVAVAAGAGAASSAGQVVRDADLVLLNLPTTDAVEEAVFGAGGVASAIEPPQLVVDFSTNEVARGKALAERLGEQTGCGWVDAPVSGGPPASGSGTLTVMAGGRDADIARVSDLMRVVAARFTHWGRWAADWSPR